MPDSALRDKCVWLTRPAEQAGAWATVLEAAGARVLREPLLAIEPPGAIATVRRQLAAAEHADMVIATSANAVHSAWRLKPEFAPRGLLFAVGAASAATLERASARPVACPPQTAASEGLLELSPLRAVAGRRVAVLAGQGGRRALVQTLRTRGARVDKLALYRRRPTTIARARLACLIDAADAIIITSGEALDHLMALADGELAARLANTRLVVPSTRVLKQRYKGSNWIYPPIVPARVSAEDVVAALARLWHRH